MNFLRAVYHVPFTTATSSWYWFVSTNKIKFINIKLRGTRNFCNNIENIVTAEVAIKRLQEPFLHLMVDRQTRTHCYIENSAVYLLYRLTVRKLNSSYTKDK